MNLTYTDADQLETTTTSSVSPSGLGYTTSQVYDPRSGGLSGLSNNTNTSVPDLASISYNLNALVGTISFNTSSGWRLANEQYSYDGQFHSDYLDTNLE